MNELIVKIKYTNTTAPFSAAEVQKAMQNLFGINTDFTVEEIYQDSFEINNLKEKQCKCPQECVF